MQKVAQEPAYVLHARAYRDTSLIVDVFSPNFGRVGLLAKGVRGQKKSSKKALLQPGFPLMLSWQGKGELPILTHLDVASSPVPLQGMAAFSLLYVNELLQRLLPRNNPDMPLFFAYTQLMDEFRSDACLAACLRRFEQALLVSLGSALPEAPSDSEGLALADDVWYRADAVHGLLRSAKQQQHTLSGREWKAFYADQMDGLSAEQKRRLRNVFRGLLRSYLGEKPLASLQLLRA